MRDISKLWVMLVVLLKMLIYGDLVIVSIWRVSLLNIPQYGHTTNTCVLVLSAAPPPHVETLISSAAVQYQFSTVTATVARVDPLWPILSDNKTKEEVLGHTWDLKSNRKAQEQGGRRCANENVEESGDGAPISTSLSVWSSLFIVQ